MTADGGQEALEQALRGDVQARGEVLDRLRPYIRFLVRALRQGRAPGRLDDSDLIQDALLEAHRAFESFRGTTPAELTAWLRPIVLRTAGKTLRGHLQARKRAADRERPAEDLAGLAVDGASSPSQQAIRHEQTARLAERLERLPEDMQEVLLGRHVERLSHAELAGRLGRSEGAVRVLYTRALQRLRAECGEL